MPVDLIANGRTRGEVANAFASNGMFISNKRSFIGKNGLSYVNVYKGSGDPRDPKSWKSVPINTNATLRREEWMQLDTQIMEVCRQRIGGIADLTSRGLVYNLGNAMGTTVLEWHDISDFGEAELTMDGVHRGENDKPNFGYNFLPIPIIHFDYEINERYLSTSRGMGNPIDTTYAERAARRCLEKQEAMLFTDTSYGYGNLDSRSRNKIYSYLNHPDRNIIAFSEVPGAHWDDSGTTGEQIIKQVSAMKQKSMNNLHYGPWMLYIPKEYETPIDLDYDKTSPSGTTIRERIMKIKGILDVKVNDMLPADNVLLVQMTSDVVRMVNGFGLTNVQWSTEGGMVHKFKVMAIQVPQIRSDQNGKSGIVHLAG